MGIDIPVKIQELRMGRKETPREPVPQTPRKNIYKENHLATLHFPGHLSFVDVVDTYKYYPTDAHVNSSASKSQRVGSQFEDPENIFESAKPKLLSLIGAVASNPLTAEKDEVIIDLILTAQSQDKIRGILVTLHSELPLITILNRVNNIIHDQASENRPDDGKTPSGYIIQYATQHQGSSLSY